MKNTKLISAAYAVCAAAVLSITGCSDKAIVSETDAESSLSSVFDTAAASDTSHVSLSSETMPPETSIETSAVSVVTTHTSATVSEIQTEPAPEVIPQGIMKASSEFFPVKTDGSTSSIAIDAAVKAAYLGGFTGEELEPYINHTKTYNSFKRLVNGDVDAIYTVPLSPEQEEFAESNNFKYESVEVAREAFVFIVNADNPVSSLTEDQLREIYSGKITNWSEVGGNDAEITLYIRNENSGSGSYFRDFMGDVPVAEGEKTYRAGLMGEIVDRVALYENGINSIGFSVYSYVTNMYPDSDKVKILDINGASANEENIMNGSYPLSSCTYFIYSADAPEDSEVRKLAEFVQTDEAQKAIEETGYMRIN